MAGHLRISNVAGVNRYLRPWIPACAGMTTAVIIARPYRPIFF